MLSPSFPSIVTLLEMSDKRKEILAFDSVFYLL